METYQIILIVIGAVAVATLFALVFAGLAFFMGIFKRKPYSELGDKRHETEMRKFVKEERKKAIAHARTLSPEQLELTSFDGLKLKGKLYKTSGQNTEKRLVVCVHGFTSHSMRECSAYIPVFDEIGIDALLVDDRAHGDSEGKYTSFSVLDRIDVKGWIDLMKPRYDKIYLLGISMGAATVAMVAGENPDDVEGVVFDCGFTSPEEEFEAMVKKYCPHLSGKPIFFFGSLWCRLILGFDFRKVSALEKVKNAKCPFLFIQGDNDPTVPKFMSDKMFEACGSEIKRQEIFPGAEHVSCFYVDNPRYVKLLKEFFAETKSN